MFSSLKSGQRPSMARLLPAPFAILLALSVAACGGSDDSSTDDASPITTSTTLGGDVTDGSSAGCDKAPASLVSEKLGFKVSEPRATDNDTVIVCTYSPEGGTSTVTVRFETGATSLDAAKSGFSSSGQPVTAYSGLGDESFTSSLGADAYRVNTMVARKGNVSVLITSSASLDAEASLMKELLDKV